ncbi:MAG: hypothetical protein KY445_03840, partial [Armatimonadetes bacterium]|nr:hypothetical protein [Armatimonadota bacterium]
GVKEVGKVRNEATERLKGAKKASQTARVETKGEAPRAPEVPNPAPQPRNQTVPPKEVAPPREEEMDAMERLRRAKRRARGEDSE